MKDILIAILGIASAVLALGAKVAADNYCPY